MIKRVFSLLVLQMVLCIGFVGCGPDVEDDPAKSGESTGGSDSKEK